MQLMMAGHFENRPAHRGLRHANQPQKGIIGQTDPNVPIGDKNALAHAFEDRFQAEFPIRQLPFPCLEPVRDKGEIPARLRQKPGQRAKNNLRIPFGGKRMQCRAQFPAGPDRPQDGQQPDQRQDNRKNEGNGRQVKPHGNPLP